MQVVVPSLDVEVISMTNNLSWVIIEMSRVVVRWARCRPVVVAIPGRAIDVAIVVESARSVTVR